MDPDRMLRNGGDLVLYPHGVALDESSSVTAVSRLREACRNILYSYCNSNALQGIAPGSSISYRRAPWQWGITVMWCCSAAVVAAGGIFVAVLWRKEVSEKKEERSAPEGGKI